MVHLFGRFARRISSPVALPSHWQDTLRCATSVATANAFSCGRSGLCEGPFLGGSHFLRCSELSVFLSPFVCSRQSADRVLSADLHFFFSCFLSLSSLCFDCAFVLSLSNARAYGERLSVGDES